MTDDKTEIWLLIGTLNIGGAEQTLVDIANNLDKCRYDVSAWTLVDEGPLVSELDDNVRYRTVDASGKWDIRSLVQFVSTAVEERPDIIQSFLFFDNIVARVAGIAPSETNVITGVRSVPDSRPPFRSLLDRLTLPLSDSVVSNSRAGAEYILNRGATPEQVGVVRNGRDIETYADGSASPELYESLALDPERPVVGTVGRLIERKGHYDLLEAWPAILDAHPDSQLLIVGDGPERDGLEQRASDLGCANSVVLAGRRDDIPDILDAMDVFVFPSHYEGLPGALLEAMIAGLPIVTTPVDGNAELVTDGETGVFVPAGDVDVIAAEVVGMLDDSERIQTLGEAAHQKATSEFRISDMVNGFESIYRQI